MMGGDMSSSIQMAMFQAMMQGGFDDLGLDMDLDMDNM